jgi:hypothetical protein
LQLFGVSDSIDFEAELFTGIDEGMDVAESIEHPHFALTPWSMVGHCTNELRGGLVGRQELEEVISDKQAIADPI